MDMLIILFLLTSAALPLASPDPNDEACLTHVSQTLKDPLKNLQNWTKPNFANPCNGFTSYLPGVTCNNGPIPQELQYLLNLAVLNLSSNRLEGVIPPQITLCAYLNVIDLHDNLLTGQIPQQLGFLSRLSAFDVSYNKLSGPIPASLGNRSGNRPSFNVTSFEGNKDLYGYPLPPMKSKGLSVLAIVGIGLGSGLASLVLSFTGVCIWLKIRDEKMAAEEGKMSHPMPDY
ncbi:hypothetical protein ES319_D11G224000v1 [Gossypium barbadense]|uniref:Receptor-like protein 44 isoform X2 n=2 Tax=Gossypium TaxID=3633 RepID=A0ABM3AYS5_GOSHI|nr:receptor-like protein 44 isoform X2 [Gossypium hirsutum]KAB2004787.1 hypothetical protein ES319_D11G224000v1 [Gossypium barbadense]